MYAVQSVPLPARWLVCTLTLYWAVSEAFSTLCCAGTEVVDVSWKRDVSGDTVSTG